MRFWKSYHPFAMTTILLWALTYVLTRQALTYFSPMSMGFLRFGVASVVMALVGLVMKMPLPKKADLPWFLAAGAAGFGLYMIVFNLGASLVTAATCSVILAFVPIVTAFLASLVFGEKLTKLHWLAFAVEFAGILVLTVSNAVLSFNWGAVWLLAGVVLMSVYNLLQRRLTRTYTALQVSSYSIFIGALMLSIFAPLAIGELRVAPVNQLWNVVLLGIPCSAVAYITWAQAFAKAPRTSLASNYGFFAPLLTGILGFLMVGEVPDLATWVGGALILTGAFLLNFREMFPKKQAVAAETTETAETAEAAESADSAEIQK